MELFLDSANMSEIKQAVDWGAIDGVTTNPSLAAKEGKDFSTMIAEICELVGGPVSAEVVATKSEAILEEARRLAKLHEHVVVKVPLIPEGLKAVKVLSAEGVKTNVTLCFSATQALMAMKAGATYLSPFVGRLDDRGQVGMELIEQCVAIKHNYGFETKTLVASVRSPNHVVESTMLGADVATLPFKILEQLYSHPLTDEGLSTFLADWESAGLKF